MYEGGKVAAMKRRRLLIEADPKYQQAKTKKNLDKLKKKMASMQKKKEAQIAAQQKEDANDEDGNDEPIDDSAEPRKKRKREDGDEDYKTEDSPPDNIGDEEEEAEEAALESALDLIQDDAGVAQHKTREEAEIDRQKLLAGELLGDGEDVVGDAATDTKKEEEEPERKLSRKEREDAILRKAGLVIVSDDEATVIGGNRVLPWRQGYNATVGGVKKENGKGASSSMKPRVTIKFKTQFDVVELDAAGRVIDKGDKDFMPSNKWTGRKGGFEFKLGERGLGYYRTGAAVVVPSNQPM
jgi:hypothetical protein